MKHSRNILILQNLRTFPIVTSDKVDLCNASISIVTHKYCTVPKMLRESLVVHEHSFDIQVNPRDSGFGSKGHHSIEVMLRTIANIHIFLGKTIWQSGD